MCRFLSENAFFCCFLRNFRLFLQKKFAKSENGVKLSTVIEKRNTDKEIKMGQQSNKVQKRARRKAYLERCKAKVREILAKGKKK